MGKAEWLQWHFSEEPWRLLPELSEEGVSENFWKNLSSGNLPEHLLLESFRKNYFFRKVFRRRVLLNDLWVFRKNFSEEPLLPESFRKNYFFQKCFLKKYCFVFFKWLKLLFYFYELSRCMFLKFYKNKMRFGFFMTNEVVFFL